MDSYLLILHEIPDGSEKTAAAVVDAILLLGGGDRQSVSALVDSLPVILCENLSEAEVKRWETALEAAGAVVEVIHTEGGAQAAPSPTGVPLPEFPDLEQALDDLISGSFPAVGAGGEAKPNPPVAAPPSPPSPKPPAKEKGGFDDLTLKPAEVSKSPMDLLERLANETTTTSSGHPVVRPESLPPELPVLGGMPERIEPPVPKPPQIKNKKTVSVESGGSGHSQQPPKKNPEVKKPPQKKPAQPPKPPSGDNRLQQMEFEGSPPPSKNPSPPAGFSISESGGGASPFASSTMPAASGTALSGSRPAQPAPPPAPGSVAGSGSSHPTEQFGSYTRIPTRPEKPKKSSPATLIMLLIVFVAFPIAFLVFPEMRRSSVDQQALERLLAQQRQLLDNLHSAPAEPTSVPQSLIDGPQVWEYREESEMQETVVQVLLKHGVADSASVEMRGKKFAAILQYDPKVPDKPILFVREISAKEVRPSLDANVLRGFGEALITSGTVSYRVGLDISLTYAIQGVQNTVNVEFKGRKNGGPDNGQQGVEEVGPGEFKLLLRRTFSLVEKREESAVPEPTLSATPTPKGGSYQRIPMPWPQLPPTKNG